MKSHSVTIQPRDSRRRYWAKVIRNGTPLPFPVSVNGASDIPGPYSRPGDDELLPGDILIEGEANHHVKARGWSYWVTAVNPAGVLVLDRQTPSPGLKARMKAAGMPAEYLTGSGDVAACVRIAQAVRMGVL